MTRPTGRRYLFTAKIKVVLHLNVSRFNNGIFRQTQLQQYCTTNAKSKWKICTLNVIR